MANADRIIELLHEAKTWPAGAERERFLAEACRDDAALKEQVISLLKADADEGKSDFLKNTLLLRPTAPVTEKPGDRIGRYKLLEQIGEGGCGVVYMAEQLEPVRRRVALKVIKLGMDTKQVIARFEAERQALAMMDHPNIAKIFDAGITDAPVSEPEGRARHSVRAAVEPSKGGAQGTDAPYPPPAATLSAGRPFFVMELVRGIKITDYCDQNNLPTNERLKLFTQVCHAIQHAHQKGIIHRDIKPSNILVTLHDDMAVPKVIDFGIAKATIGQLTDKTVFTAFAQFIGTPAYMSPEQAQMSGLDIDTRADIYSLGVLLYELLTGNTPFDAKELLAAGMDEMRRKIREDEPAKPSTCLSTMEAMDLTTVARHRHAEPPKLIHLLRGDLDWLVMKCLEKDRTRRYETANALAMDLQRHMDNEPVVARPPTNLYRFQKLVRRNKLAFAAASAITAALVLGLGISTWMFFKERQAHQRAVAAEQDQARLRLQAEAEAAESRRVATFLADLARRLHQERNFTNAEAVLREELVMERKLSGDEHPFVANSLRHLATVLRDSGRVSEAEGTFRKELAMRRKLLGHEHPSVARSLAWLGTILSDQGKHAEAEEMFREALAMRRKLLGNEHPDVTTSLAWLGTTLSGQAKHAEAEAVYREALALRRKLLGNEHAEVADLLLHLAKVLDDSGKKREAEAVIREALGMLRKLFGNEHPEVADSLSRLGTVLSNQGKHAEAGTTHREALAMLRKLFGNGHADVVASLSKLADELKWQGRLAEAEALLREELVHVRTPDINAPSQVRPELGLILHHLADVLREREALKEARALAEEASTLYERHPDWPAAERQHAARVLAYVLMYLRDYAVLEALDRKMINDLRARPAADDPQLIAALAESAFHLSAQGKFAEAEMTHREALAMRRKLFGNEHPEVARSLDSLAFVLGSAGKLPEAETTHREALAMRRKLLGREHPDAAFSLNRLTRVLRDQGKLAEAEALLRDELVHVRTPDTNAPAQVSPMFGFVLHRLADVLRERKALKEARSFAEEASTLYERHPDWSASERERALRVLTAVLTDLGDSAGLEALDRKKVNDLRVQLPADDPQLAAALVRLTLTLLVQKKFAEAEPPARECLTIREKKLPDDWQTFNARSLLGSSLLGQKKYAEAEALLLSGYEGMTQREDKIPANGKVRLQESLQRLVQLYEATGQSEKAGEWNKKLADFDKAEMEKKATITRP